MDYQKIEKAAQRRNRILKTVIMLQGRIQRDCQGLFTYPSFAQLSDCLDILQIGIRQFDRLVNQSLQNPPISWIHKSVKFSYSFCRGCHTSFQILLIILTFRIHDTSKKIGHKRSRHKAERMLVGHLCHRSS